MKTPAGLRHLKRIGRVSESGSLAWHLVYADPRVAHLRQLYARIRNKSDLARVDREPITILLHRYVTLHEEGNPSPPRGGGYPSTVFGIRQPLTTARSKDLDCATDTLPNKAFARSDPVTVFPSASTPML